MQMFIVWLAVAVAFIALEVHTQALYALFVGVAAAAAAVTDLVTGSLWLQGIVFAVVTAGGVSLVRPWLRSRFDHSVPIAQFRGIQGSAEGLVGQAAITIDTVGDEHHPGHALFAGERWLAVTDLLTPVAAEVPVVVVGVRGTTLLVRPS